MTEEKKLLTTDELSVCKQVAASDDLHGKRALALIALNDEQSQQDAGQQSGLTKGQIRYLLTRFRQKRMDIFPAEVLDALPPAPEKAEKSKGAPSKDKKTDGKAPKKKKDKKRKKKKSDKKKSKKGKKSNSKKKKGKAKKQSGKKSQKKKGKKK